MRDSEYQRQMASYGRMPYEAAILTYALYQVGQNTSGSISTIFSVLSAVAALFWVMVTFYVAREPHLVRGFGLLEPYVFLGVLLALGGVLFTTCCGFQDAILIAVFIPIFGIFITAIAIRVIRVVF